MAARAGGGREPPARFELAGRDRRGRTDLRRQEVRDFELDFVRTRAERVLLHPSRLNASHRARRSRVVVVVVVVVVSTEPRARSCRRRRRGAPRIRYALGSVLASRRYRSSPQQPGPAAAAPPRREITQLRVRHAIREPVPTVFPHVPAAESVDDDARGQRRRRRGALRSAKKRKRNGEVSARASPRETTRGVTRGSGGSGGSERPRLVSVFSPCLATRSPPSAAL